LIAIEIFAFSSRAVSVKSRIGPLEKYFKLDHFLGIPAQSLPTAALSKPRRTLAHSAISLLTISANGIFCHVTFSPGRLCHLRNGHRRPSPPFSGSWAGFISNNDARLIKSRPLIIPRIEGSRRFVGNTGSNVLFEFKGSDGSPDSPLKIANGGFRLEFWSNHHHFAIWHLSNFFMCVISDSPLIQFAFTLLCDFHHPLRG
jgi:hypothetical protein